ncbi:MAG TPA: hypothetical protein VG942_10660 [Hyphomonadaceae bacterium]|nr:hypothetical protein [Hyphomonadaceae bacterium]
MRRFLGLFALAAILSFPAIAQTGAADGPPTLWVDLPPVYQPAAHNPSDGKFKLGNRTIEFEKTKLTALASDIKMPVGERGDASTSLHWVCMHAANQRIWLTSDEIGGGKIDGIVLATPAPGEKASKACQSAPASLAKVSLPHGLSLGMTEEALRTLLGKPSYAKNGIIGYVFEQTAGQGQVSARLWVRIDGGKISALDLGQVTTL